MKDDGLGAAVVRDTRVASGPFELGHIGSSSDSDLICRCGKTGCVEVLATPWNMASRLKLAGPDAWIKYTGDGGMVVVPAAYAAELINFCVRVHEKVKDGAHGQSGSRGDTDYGVTSGIATGKLKELTMPDGRRDFIGQTADRAARLGGIATASAILVDGATIAAANMILVHSEIGKIMRRPVEGYIGKPESANLRGISQSVNFHEIFYAEQVFGLKAETNTRSTALLAAATQQSNVPLEVTLEQSNPKPVTAITTRQSPPTERKVGTVDYWDRVKGFGRLLDAAGRKYHVTARHMAVLEDVARLVPGQRVAFVTSNCATDGRTPTALCVLVDGQDYQGVVTAIPEAKPHGWIRVVDLDGNHHPVFAPKRGMAPLVSRGAIVDFRIELDDRGAQAIEVTLTSDVA